MYLTILAGSSSTMDVDSVVQPTFVHFFCVLFALLTSIQTKPSVNAVEGDVQEALL